MLIESSNLPLIEPEIVSCVFLSGVDCTFQDGVFRFTGWDETNGERVVRVRWAVTMPVLRQTHARLKDMIAALSH